VDATAEREEVRLGVGEALAGAALGIHTLVSRTGIARVKPGLV
jgi:hypothetical protein